MKRKNETSNLSDFTRYIRGEMTKREENAFQRKLQRDPFAEEATDGLLQISPDEAAADLKMIEQRLKTRISGRQRVMYYRVAASIAVLMIISTVFIVVNRNNHSDELSKTAVVQTPAEAPEPEANKQQSELETASGSVGGTESSETHIADEALTQTVTEEVEEEIQAGAGAEKPQNLPVQAEEVPAPLIPEERVAAVAAPAAYLKKEAVAEVRGTIVSSEDNLPIPGALVSLKGTDTRALTDNEGKFMIPLADTTPAVLVADFIGMERQEFKAKEDTDMKISMTPSVMALNEVVTVAYGAKSAKGISSDVTDYEGTGYTPAQPVEGKDNFDKYIEDNIRKPESLPSGQRAVVVLSFTVTSTGVINSIKIIRSPGQEFSDEAIRLLHEGPAWKPAEENGQPVDEEVRIRIVFK